MSEHCIVNGQRCSKCCEVLTIRESKNFREWRSYVRRHGYPEDFKPELKVHHRVKKISKRRAKKINPDLVRRIGNNQSYWLCKSFTGSACGDYENRPDMCSGYPYYGMSEQDWFKSDHFKRGPLYSSDCTFYIEVVNANS